jgi:3-dehydroquinate synthase
MCLEARLSMMLHFLDMKQVDRIKALIESYGMPSEIPADIDINNMLTSMQLDKKAVAGELKFILPERIGSVRIHKGIYENIIRELLGE